MYTERLFTKAIGSTKIYTEPKAQWNPANYITERTTPLHSTSFSSLLNTRERTRTHTLDTTTHARTQVRHSVICSVSRGEKTGLKGRFNWCYGRKVTERVGKIIPESSTEEGTSTRWKKKEQSISKRAEMARRNIQLDESREIGRGLIGMVRSTLTVSGMWRLSTWLWLSWGYSVFRDRALSSPSSLTVFDGTLCMIRDMCRCLWRTPPRVTLLCILLRQKLRFWEPKTIKNLLF